MYRLMNLPQNCWQDHREPPSCVDCIGDPNLGGECYGCYVGACCGLHATCLEHEAEAAAYVAGLPSIYPTGWRLSHGRTGSYEAWQSDPGCDGDPHDGGTCGDSSHRCTDTSCCLPSDAPITRMGDVVMTSVSHDDDDLPF